MTISLTRVPSVSGDVPGEPEERVVIDGASITVDQGEAVALVGESGSGKSLLVMASVDLLNPSARVMSGTTVFEGHVLQELDDPDWRSLVGMGIGVLLQDAIGS
ncbi:MAG: ATP-binding cassette domain-containing protein [Acidobacteria bacterium]|nr:ATP-binding cassette domain-containing protein [Acidobacteriota bacterium]